MPTPFICRKCTAQLAGSAFRLFSPNRPRLNNSTAIRAEQRSYAVLLPGQHDDIGQPESSQSKRPTETLETDDGDHSTVPLASSAPQQQGQDDGASETTTPTRWHGGFEKYVLDRRTAAGPRPKWTPPESARELKARILAARGYYKQFYRDLLAFYVLSPFEAYHAVGQLERLVLGRQTISKAAARLDVYHVWKESFTAVLHNPDAVPYGGVDSVSIGAIRSRTTSPGDEVTSIKTAWPKLDSTARQRLWPTMVLSAFQSEPQTLPTLIQSTFDFSWCPSYVLEDVLYLLFCRHQRALKTGDQDDCDQIEQAMEEIATFVLDKYPPKHLVLGQAVLHLILSRLATPDLVLRYQLLKTLEHPLHANTLLHLASRFAKRFDTKAYAVDILHVLTGRPGFDLNTPAAASVCTSLLNLNENEPLPDQDVAPDDLFEFLLKRGLRPNLLELSALMRNFCIRGHLDTAWKIFELMLEYGLEPDQHVYSILLNASKENHDIDSLEQISKIITSRNAWSTPLMNDFLDLIFQENEMQLELRRRQRKKGSNSWRPMIQLYAKFFKLEPLQKFILFPLENMLEMWGVQLKHQTTAIKLAEHLTPLPDSRLMKPDNTTLCTMIAAHMRSILTPRYAIRYYNYFFKLVNRKDPAALKLLADQRTWIVDTFLRALMQFKSTTGFAILRFRKMMTAARKEKTKHGRYLYHHPPSVHTWTIMLNGLKNHNDTRGVIAILDLMINTSRIKPTLPTWNAVIQGFARTRSVNAAVKAVGLLEKAGFQPNDRTIKALRMFPRPMREQVIVRLEQMRKAQQTSQETETLSRASITKPIASKTEGVDGFSSDVPLHRMMPVMRKALYELAQYRDRLNYRDYIMRKRQTKKSRIPTELNSGSPYLGIQTHGLNRYRII
ncbi:hypothetical protein F4859DRAFT_441980 [Xylaria cf. heliscus]|nr:hypothetical protein F4859DRAFT_441980 [Xylaria cf. heliscus]